MKLLAAFSLTLVLLATPLAAEKRLRPMTAVGTVWINHVALPSGASVASGDRVHTAHDSVALFDSDAAGRLEVRPSSVVYFHDDNVDVIEGAVGSAGQAVTVAGNTIESTNAGDAWFVVAEQNGELWVAAYQGEVRIKSASDETVTVPAGSFATTSTLAAMREVAESEAPQKEDAQAEQPSTDEPKRRRRPAADPRRKRNRKGAAGAASKGGWTIGGLSNTASIAVVTAVGAGAVTGATLGFANLLGESPSPSQ